MLQNIMVDGSHADWDVVVKILVVDDDDTTLQLMRMLIEHRGEAAYLFHTPHDALAAVAEIQPDLIVLDLLLGGGMTGLEAAVLLRRMDCCGGTPILAITAAPETVTRDMALAAGCNLFLAKPFKVADWQQAVQRLVP